MVEKSEAQWKRNGIGSKEAIYGVTPDGETTVEEDNEGYDVDNGLIEGFVSWNFNWVFQHDSSFAQIDPHHSKSQERDHEGDESTVENANEEKEDD